MHWMSIDFNIIYIYISKNFKNNISSIADVSLNDHACFNHYSEASGLYRKTTRKEKDNDKPIDPNFSPINNFDYVNQLRVLTVPNENFEVDPVPLYDEFMLSKNQIKRKYFQNNFAQSKKNRVKSKWLEKMKQLKKHILFFDFLENHYVPSDEVSKQLDTVKTNFVKTSPFKFSNDQTPITRLIEQHNFEKSASNKSLHVMGQQPGHIENTISIKKSDSEKSVLIEKLLLDLSSQKEKVLLKTSQSKMLEVVDKMLFDLKIKIESTPRSTTCDISKNEKEIISAKHTDSDTVPSVPAKEILNDELPEIKRFVENSKPMSFTQDWYSRPIPPHIQFKERVFQPQFSVSINKLYKWNIVEQKIMSHMSEVDIAYQNNHDIDQPDLVNLLVNGFSSTLCEWRDLYPTSLPIYTTLKYFVGTPNSSPNISPRTSGLLKNILRCSTMTDYRWYQDVFISRIMLWKDCHKPYWKERFIEDLSPIFAHKVK